VIVFGRESQLAADEWGNFCVVILCGVFEQNDEQFT
jgi:hypothetical protein